MGYTSVLLLSEALKMMPFVQNDRIIRAGKCLQDHQIQEVILKNYKISDVSPPNILMIKMSVCKLG